MLDYRLLLKAAELSLSIMADLQQILRKQPGWKMGGKIKKWDVISTKQLRGQLVRDLTRSILQALKYHKNNTLFECCLNQIKNVHLDLWPTGLLKKQQQQPDYIRKIILLCFSTDWEQFIGGILSKHVTQIQKTQWAPQYTKNGSYNCTVVKKIENRKSQLKFFFLHNLFHEAGQPKNTMHFYFQQSYQSQSVNCQGVNQNYICHRNKILSKSLFRKKKTKKTKTWRDIPLFNHTFAIKSIWVSALQSVHTQCRCSAV